MVTIKPDETKCGKNASLSVLSVSMNPMLYFALLFIEPVLRWKCEDGIKT